MKLPYKRRDEGFGSLGAFTKGMSPLSPALMDVQKDDTSDKYMMWPLTFAQPGSSSSSSSSSTKDDDGDGDDGGLGLNIPKDALAKAGEGQWRTIKVVKAPSKVVAIREFSGEYNRIFVSFAIQLQNYAISQSYFHHL